MNQRAEVIKEVIASRRSVFPANYIDKPIPHDAIELILESANHAPTHKLTEPWRFTVYLNDGKLKLGEELARIYKETTAPEKFLQKKYDSISLKTIQAGCIIVIKAQHHPEKLPEWEEIAALGCAVQNMALTAESLDIGAYWSSPGIIKFLGIFLELRENEKCYGFFYMGYHNAPKRIAIRTPIEDKVTWVKE